jgi:hypothetical protein
MVRRGKGCGYLLMPPRGVVRNAPALTKGLVGQVGSDAALTALSPLLKIILKGFAMQIIPLTYWNI